MKSWEVWTGVLVVWLLGGVAVGGLSYFYEMPTLLLVGFGWARFLEDNAPRMTFDWTAVALGIGAMALFVAVGHLTFRSLAVRGETASSLSVRPVHWKLRWTLAILAVVLLMFVAGTSMVGFAHQALWLATSPEPMYDEVLGGWYGESNPGSISNNLKSLGMGFHGFHDMNRGLPEGSAPPRGQAQHSWGTLIAPFMFYSAGEMDLKKPWRDPTNDQVFRKLRPDLLNPSYPKDTWRNEEGYGLNHYSANERVLGPKGVRRLDDITDGAGNTLLIGEVDANFEPWGKPGNWRDPALGLNRSPNGFGCRRAARFVYFVMADGSVRQFRDDIDPEVLRAFATPTAADEAQQ
jgi:hypothetical protein